MLHDIMFHLAIWIYPRKFQLLVLSFPTVMCGAFFQSDVVVFVQS